MIENIRDLVTERWPDLVSSMAGAAYYLWKVQSQNLYELVILFVISVSFALSAIEPALRWMGVDKDTRWMLLMALAAGGVPMLDKLSDLVKSRLSLGGGK